MTIRLGPDSVETAGQLEGELTLSDQPTLPAAPPTLLASVSIG